MAGTRTPAKPGKCFAWFVENKWEPPKSDKKRGGANSGEVKYGKMACTNQNTSGLLESQSRNSIGSDEKTQHRGGEKVSIPTVDGRHPAPSKKPWLKTIVCWYLQGNRIIPAFLRWCVGWISQPSTAWVVSRVARGLPSLRKSHRGSIPNHRAPSHQ